jgi:hypothetical protein
MHITSLLKRLAGSRGELAPSLYDLYPHADSLPRSLPRAEVVPAVDIDGTTRNPSNTTTEFLPVPALRTEHWRQNWRRMLDAQEHDTALPPVHLLKVDARFFVVDGHKRVASARKFDGALDALVVELNPQISH